MIFCVKIIFSHQLRKQKKPAANIAQHVYIIPKRYRFLLAMSTSSHKLNSEVKRKSFNFACVKKSRIVVNSYSDQELWTLLQEGNRLAFEALYHRYARLLFHEISKRIDRLEKVDDLLQDIFLTLWEKRCVYQPKGEIYPYLYGMALNRVLNYYRQHRAKPHFVELWDNLPEDQTKLGELPIAFQHAHREELETLLEQAITSLPPRMRQVYELRYEENRTISEVASLLSISPHTVHNQLKIIRKRFTRTLKNTSFLFYVKLILSSLLNH